MRLALLFAIILTGCAGQPERPNILFCMADDWGPDHAGILGDPLIETPSFDRLAEEGVLFTNAYVALPSCTGSRAAILSGQMPHRLTNAANLSSRWEDTPPLFTDLLSEAGYHVGYTRKGWGPGQHPGRKLNPCGRKYDDFDAFLEERPEGAPFFFWFGSTDPHRGYNRELTEEMGISPDDVPVPPYLPDVPEIRQDLADYYAEVRRFDTEVGQLVRRLEESGELENTVVVMTGDHGLPFPRAKGHLYDSGAHVPLAIRWGSRAEPERRVTDFVSFTDFAPTFLDLAGVGTPAVMTGRSFLNVLLSSGSGRVDSSRDHVFAERERHTWCHPDGQSFPVRSLRTDEFLYIWNIRPYLYPAGHPCLRREGKTPKGHVDCDEGPSKYFLIDHQEDPEYAPFYQRAFGLRPEEELYAVEADPHQLRNLAADPAHATTLAQMRDRVRAWMKETGDPRADGETDIWDAPCEHLQPHADVKLPCYEEAQERSDAVREQ